MKHLFLRTLKSKLAFFLAALLWGSQAQAQQLASFQVSLDKRYHAELAIPVQVNLDEITYLPDSLLQLVRVSGKQRQPVAFQVEKNGHRTLHWIVDPLAGKSRKATYVLEKGKTPGPAPEGVQVEVKDGLLTVKSRNQNLLRYHYKTLMPPAGVNPAFQRSGFIHPLWSPHGQELTRISPPDHYHHFGLWNPWTKVLFEGETVDFWNLGARKGTVRFANFVSVSDGPVFGDYKALHEHVVFKKNGPEKVALNEVQGVRVFRPAGQQDYYLADFTIQYNCASDSPVTLQEYRYGGLGWRATEKWDRHNSRVLTSEGKARPESDGSKARWVLVQGAIDAEQAGVVMMSFPTNYNYPEPLRVWPENSNKRGDMFVNFSPTKDKDWPLKAGQNYLLRYRLLVFNGNFSQEKAESAWQAFAHPPKIQVKIN